MVRRSFRADFQTLELDEAHHRVVVVDLRKVQVRRTAYSPSGCGRASRCWALLEIPTTSWLGQRNRLLLTLLYNTGARVSEIVGVRAADVCSAIHVSFIWKARAASKGSVPVSTHSEYAMATCMATDLYLKIFS